MLVRIVIRPSPSIQHQQQHHTKNRVMKRKNDEIIAKLKKDVEIRKLIEVFNLVDLTHL